MDESAVRYALEKAVEPRRLNELRERANSVPHGSYLVAYYPYPPDYDVFSELAQPLKLLLKAQPEFSNGLMIASGDGASGLLNELPRLLVKRAALLDVDASIIWLKELLATKTAKAIQVLPVWGVRPNVSIRLTDEVSLTRIDELPPSYHLNALQAPRIESLPIFAVEPPAAALTGRFTVSPLIFESGKSATQHTALIDLHEIRRCLGLVGPGLLTSTVEWTQILNEDLNELLGYGRMYRAHEIQPHVLQDAENFDALTACEIVQNYFVVDPVLRPKINLAISRFDQALRRYNPGDAALELCIALEALLVGDGPGELTWKVSLRAALLIGGTKEEKRANRSIIKALYQTRSRVVHTGLPPEFEKVEGINTNGPKL
jgi:hypothetical protein